LWTECISLVLGTSSWLFWTWQWTFGFHRREKFLTECLRASQEGFCFMEFSNSI
jgi:hypothetical protein